MRAHMVTCGTCSSSQRTAGRANMRAYMVIYGPFQLIVARCIVLLGAWRVSTYAGLYGRLSFLLGDPVRELMVQVTCRNPICELTCFRQRTARRTSLRTHAATYAPPSLLPVRLNL